MSELERGQKLSEIARNSAFELNSVAAIKELNKMDGTYARANNPITSRVSSGKVAMAIQALIIDEMGDIPKQADDAEFAELEELETVEDENFEEGLDKDDNLLYNGEEED